MAKTVSRRGLLAQAVGAAIATVAGCTSAQNAPDTSEPTETTTEVTHSSPTPEPEHTIDLSLVNRSDADHILSVLIEDTSGEVVLEGSYALGNSEAITHQGVLSALTGEQVTYVVNASLEDGTRTEETFGVRSHIDLHLLAIFITQDGDVAIDRMFH